MIKLSMAAYVLIGAAACATFGGPPPREQALSRLGSQEYAARHAATVELLSNRSLTRDWIASLYAAAQTPEQRHRVLAVAQHHAIRLLRKQVSPGRPDAGSLGVVPRGLPEKDLPHVRGGAILIVQTLPGFPAHETLIRGDLILAVDGRKLSAESSANVLETDFTNRIKSKRSGETVRLSVLRDEETFELGVNLASLKALNQMYQNSLNMRNPPELTEPFQRQWNKQYDKLLSFGLPVRSLSAQVAPASDEDD